MNNIDKNFSKKTSLAGFAKKYFSYLNKVLESIDDEDLNKLEKVFDDVRSKENTIFVAGNGGSAATAMTMANDIGFDILKKTSSTKPFRVFSLCDNSSVITAIANDVGYENVFISQLKIHYREGDILLAISASGNSENIIHASNWVKSRGGKVIAFLGFDGGKLIDTCDYKIHVKSKSGEYGPVEDAHLVINHVLAHWFQNKLRQDI